MPEPLRLAFLGDPNSLHTRRWVAWFADRGHDVRLIDPFATTLTDGFPANVRVVSLPPPGRSLPLLSLLARRRGLRRLLARLGTQVLHGHFVRRFGWQAALSGFRPLVISPWGSDILRVPRGAVRTRWWNRFALRSANLVTVSSEGMRVAAIRAGARPERVQHIHHGVDTAHFAPGPPDQELAARLAIGTAGVIVAPRSIRPLYRQVVVVDAVARLVAAGRDLVLVMSARGADPATLAEVRSHADASGISDRLRILDDVPHDELPALFRLADVIVSVPETDSFPETVLEAMACERPIVASDLPAVTPVLGQLDPTAASLVVPVGDAGATAAAIARAVDLDPDLRREMGATLRAHVVQTADYETNMARMERLYQKLAAGR
jgi:glycosyltransferase involved in cell wall biosynthesis